MDDFLKMRDGNHDEAFFIFMNEILPCIVGKKKCKMYSYQKLVREFAEVSDESFGLVVLKNKGRQWEDMYVVYETPCCILSSLCCASTGYSVYGNHAPGRADSTVEGVRVS